MINFFMYKMQQNIHNSTLLIYIHFFRRRGSAYPGCVELKKVSNQMLSEMYTVCEHHGFKIFHFAGGGDGAILNHLISMDSPPQETEPILQFFNTHYLIIIAWHTFFHRRQ